MKDTIKKIARNIINGYILFLYDKMVICGNLW